MNIRTKEYRKDPDRANQVLNHRYLGVPPVIAANGDTFFGLWLPKEIPVSDQDSFVQVKVGREQNWALISYVAYGTTKWDWMLHQINKGAYGVPDSMTEPLLAGITLRLPALTTLMELDKLQNRSLQTTNVQVVSGGTVTKPNNLAQFSE